MNGGEVPRIAAPLLIAAAILLSFRLEQRPPAPVELAAGEAPAPSAAQVEAAYEAALAAGAPGYDRGSRHAPVAVLEFADFGCPYCARFAAETYPQLADEFVKTGRVRWKYVPFVLGMFPNGGEAARAAECAAEQGAAAFGRMHDALFARQSDWQSASDPDGVFRALAGAVGLDAARFTTCYASEAPERRIHASGELADRMGVRATPTFFVGGRRVEGALPAAEFRAVLLDALARDAATEGRRTP
jgi:protein-disulfide isomerase